MLDHVIMRKKGKNYFMITVLSLLYKGSFIKDVWSEGGVNQCGRLLTGVGHKQDVHSQNHIFIHDTILTSVDGGGGGVFKTDEVGQGQKVSFWLEVFDE